MKKLSEKQSRRHFHNLRHTSSKGNDGLMVRLWDRLLGIENANVEVPLTRRH